MSITLWEPKAAEKPKPLKACKKCKKEKPEDELDDCNFCERIYSRWICYDKCLTWCDKCKYGHCNYCKKKHEAECAYLAATL